MLREGLVDSLNIAGCIEEPTEGLVARLAPAHVHDAFLEQRIRRDHDEVSELAVNAQPRADPRPERHRAPPSATHEYCPIGFVGSSRSAVMYRFHQTNGTKRQVRASYVRYASPKWSTSICSSA